MTPPATEPRGRRAGLSFKLVLTSTLVTAVVVSLAFLVLSIEIRQTSRDLFVEQLGQTQRSLAELQSRSMKELLWTASLTTQSPTLHAAMETWQDESDRKGKIKTQLQATVEREVARMQNDLGKDLLVVTDENGRVLAAKARSGPAPAPGEDLGRLPAVRAALGDDAPVRTTTFALLALGDEYFQVGAVRIELGGYPIGVLLVGDRLAGAFLRRLRGAFPGDIVVATPKHVVATTLAAQPELAARFQGLTPPKAGGPPPAGTLKVAGEEFTYASFPLGLDATGEPAMVYLLDSVTGTLASAEQTYQRDFLLYGLLAVVLVGSGAALLSQTVLSPLGGFVRFMRSVAEKRDYSLRFNAADAGPEVQTLKQSYDHLMESLEAQHTELSLHSARLGEINQQLTHQILERERAERALEESEQQLRQAQKLEAIGTLAGGVAHDFNNLLTVISGHTQMLSQEMETASPFQQDLAEIRAAAERAAGLTRQLLAFSRKQVIQPRVLDLNAVVGSVQSLLRRLIGEDIEFSTTLPSPEVWVRADPNQLEQVLLNLAVNARDAMPDGGKLTVEVERADAGGMEVPAGAKGWVRLAVQDTGIGMDETIQERIFEPFFTTKGPGRGTGLGLSTVYGIVQQSGGRIQVKSAPGLGTTFQVFLPEVEAEPEALVSIPVETVDLRGRETILLVEDETAIRMLVLRYLTQQGYVVLSASGGKEAIEVLAKHQGHLDLLLTDVVMQGMSGREVYRTLSATRPDLRVLYLSGYSDDIIARQGLLEPGTELLEKPFRSEQLLERVRQVLDRPREVTNAAA